MTSASHPFYTLVLLLTICHHGLGSSIKIHVRTHYQNDVFPNSFNIRCAMGPHGNCAKTINLLKISKDDGKTIAGIQRDDSIFYDHLRKASVTAEGHIDRDYNNRTFLSATVRDAVKEDSGLYSCIVHYIDKYGHLKEEASSYNVSIHGQELQDVVRSLLVNVSFLDNLMEFHKQKDQELQEVDKDLLVRVSVLEDEMKSQQEKADKQIASLEKKLLDQKDEIKQKMSELEEAGIRRRLEIQEIVDRDSFFSAFSVYQAKTPVSKGEHLYFTKSRLNVGSHYNLTSGVFTVPKRGLYAFHLSVLTDTDDFLDVCVMVNNSHVSCIYTKDTKYSDQTSTSIILSLDTGDSVWPRVYDGNDLYWNEYPYTVFSGYLLKLV